MPDPVSLSDLGARSERAYARSLTFPRMVTEALDLDDVKALLKERDRAYGISAGVLADWMNRVHERTYSDRFWGIILYRFLSFYVENVLTRYLLIGELRRNDLEAIGLCPEEYIVPKFERELNHMYERSSFFDLQLLSQVAEVLRVSLRCQSASEFDVEMDRWAFSYPSGWSAIRQWIGRTGRRAFNRSALMYDRRSCILFPMHMPRTVRWRLKLASGIPVADADYTHGLFQSAEADRDLRRSLEIPTDIPVLARCVLATLRHNLPTDYLEGFRPYLDEAEERIHEGRPAAVVAGYIRFLSHRVWAALCAERGTNLVLVQHGGFGMQAAELWEDIELSLADTYVTWGWVDDDHTVPMPAPRLMKAQRAYRATIKEEVLFVLQMSRAFLNIRELWRKNIDADQRHFVEQLSSEIRSSLVARIVPYKHIDRDVQATWRKDFGDVSIDWAERSIYDALARSKLVILDQLFSTTLTECLSLGIPVVLFSRGDFGMIHPRAQDAFEALRLQGIVHDDPASAAQLVNEISNDIESWWYEPARARAVAHFRDIFARTDDHAFESWKQLLEDASKPIKRKSE